jgi:hypothetical protein
MSEWNLCMFYKIQVQHDCCYLPLLETIKPTILNLDSTDKTQMLKTSTNKSSNIRSCEGQLCSFLGLGCHKNNILCTNELSTYMSHEIAN